jgi:hypothetical protein
MYRMKDSGIVKFSRVLEIEIITYFETHKAFKYALNAALNINKIEF